MRTLHGVKQTVVRTKAQSFAVLGQEFVVAKAHVHLVFISKEKSALYAIYRAARAKVRPIAVLAVPKVSFRKAQSALLIAVLDTTLMSRARNVMHLVEVVKGQVITARLVNYPASRMGQNVSQAAPHIIILILSHRCVLYLGKQLLRVASRYVQEQLRKNQYAK